MQLSKNDLICSARAFCYSVFGRNEQAREMYRRALEGREKRLGKNHRSVVALLLAMEETYSRDASDLQPRLELLVDAAQRLKQTSPHGIRLSRVLHMTGRAQKNLGDIDGALVSHEEAERAYAYSNPLCYQRCANLNDLADLLKLKGDFESSRRHRAKADEIYLILSCSPPRMGPP